MDLLNIENEIIYRSQTPFTQPPFSRESSLPANHHFPWIKHLHIPLEKQIHQPLWLVTISPLYTLNLHLMQIHKALQQSQIWYIILIEGAHDFKFITRKSLNK